MASLDDAFRSALAAKSEAVGAKEALQFVQEHHENMSKVLSLFTAAGELKGGADLPASCFNDYYKFTMLPVVRTVERARSGDIRCTFSVNIRDTEYRKQLYESAVGKAPPDLFNELKHCLSTLTRRKFDRDVFERCTSENSLPGWGPETLDAICGTREEPRMLVQEFQADPACSTPQAPSSPGSVLVQVFVARDEKLQEERVYVEATGPWHRVTWLETSMMQAVYDALLRDQKRKQYCAQTDASGQWVDSSWYPAWLADAFCRCVRSVEAAKSSGLKGALFTGRRTGGLALMMIQGLYVQHAFKNSDGTPLMLGTSSVTARYMSLDAGVSPEYVPRCAGTHAHELSMGIGAVLGEIDDQAGMPVSQLIGHLLYFYTSVPRGDVRDVSRKPTMPMLPDTLGTRAFMRVADKLKVPMGPHKGDPVLSIFGAARQDSGGLEAFRSVMEDFGFKGALMASEIEGPDDLMTASAAGYKLFGAGGFMGDSEKAWDPNMKNISMAVKVLRVHVNGKKSPFVPVKTGETGDEGMIKEGKFEADGTLAPEELKGVRERAQVLANAEPKLDDAALQDLFERTLSEFLGEWK